MQTLNQKQLPIIVAGFIAAVFDLFVVMSYALSFLSLIYVVFVFVNYRKRNNLLDKLKILVALIVPLFVYSGDLAIKAVEERDIKKIVQNERWREAKNLTDLVSASQDISWVSKRRFLAFGYENTEPTLKTLGFNGYIFQYNLRTGAVKKYTF